MQDCEKYFLIVAKELNITRAAKKLFITQQCLSEHIRKLEKKYDTQLFVRTPRLALTPEGEALVHALGEINVIETAYIDQIHNVGTGTKGSIVLGITQIRSFILIPIILPKYSSVYPNVSISVIVDSAEELEQKLEEGKLDMFTGISSMAKNTLSYTLLVDEHTYLCISDDLLKKYTPSLLPHLADFKKTGIRLEQFHNVPFAINLPREHIRSYYNLLSMNLIPEPNIILELDDPFARMQLSSRNFCATIINKSMISYVNDLNKISSDGNLLHVIPINNDTPYPYNNVIATNKKAYIPKYRQAFIKMVQEYYSSILKE